VSYGSNAGADTYHADRGNTAWAAATEAAKTIARLRGSEYVDYHFRAAFPGYKTGFREQVREWPRTDAYDYEDNHIGSSVIPYEVEYATYEAALRELATPGSLFPELIPGQQRKRTKVDVIEVEYTGPQGIASVTPIITVITGILSPILTGHAQSSLAGRTIRA
jgi:hypothetical protein